VQCATAGTSTRPTRSRTRPELEQPHAPAIRILWWGPSVMERRSISVVVAVTLGSRVPIVNSRADTRHRQSSGPSEASGGRPPPPRVLRARMTTESRNQTRCHRRARDRRRLEASAGVRREVPLALLQQHHADPRPALRRLPTRPRARTGADLRRRIQAVPQPQPRRDEGPIRVRDPAPVTAWFASSNTANPDSWQRLARGEKPDFGEAVRSKLVGLKPAHVWDISQTDGEPIPETPRPTLLHRQTPEGCETGWPIGSPRTASSCGSSPTRSRSVEQTADRLHDPRGVGATHGHGRRRPGKDARARTGSRHAPRTRQRRCRDAPTHRRGRGRVGRTDGRCRAWSGDRRLHDPDQQLETRRVEKHFREELAR
jgi:hypothetical protein